MHLPCQVTSSWWVCSWKGGPTPWSGPCVETASHPHRWGTWTPSAWQQHMATGITHIRAHAQGVSQPEVYPLPQYWSIYTLCLDPSASHKALRRLTGRYLGRHDRKARMLAAVCSSCTYGFTSLQLSQEKPINIQQSELVEKWSGRPATQCSC